MTEVNEVLGIGDTFKIDGTEYEVHIATIGELKTIEKKVEGLYLQPQSIYLNFMKLTKEKDNKERDERAKKLFDLLQIIFPDAPIEKLEKMNRKEVARAVDHFLFD